MPWERYALGYHGCDAEVARRVAAGDDALAPSTNDYDWLGHGQYFREDSPQRALQWAEQEARRRPARVQRPAVLGAVIDLGNCLNLIDAEHLAAVEAAHRRFREALRQTGITPPANQGRDFRLRRLDCAVFEALHQFTEDDGLPPFDTVRAFFVEGEALYPGAGLRRLDHIQICVRRPEQIRGYFLPRSNQ